MIEAIGGSTILAIVGVLVLAVSSLAGLVFFVNKEENFEDAVAAKKKEQEALLASLQSTGKSKKNKNYNKVKSKKAAKKENAETNQESAVDEEESAEPAAQITIDSTPKAKEPTPEPVKKEEEKKVEKPLKKQKEKKVENDKKDGPPKQHKKMVIEEVASVKEETKVEAAPPKKIVVEEIKPKIETNTKAAPPPKEDEKKKKSKKQPKSKENGPSGIVGIAGLISGVEDSQLDPSEVQQLIDILLARQNENEKWHKPKGDPVEVLKKQLSDSDIQLHEERKLAQSAALKNKELKNELQQERSQRQNFEQMINRYAQQTKELENARKQLEEKHLSETQSTQAQITRMQQLIDGGSQREFHQLADENQHLKRAQQQVIEEKNKLMNDINQLQKSQQSMKQDYDNAMMQFKQQLEQSQMSIKEKLLHSENELKLSKKAQNDAEISLAKVQASMNELNGKNKVLETHVSDLKTQNSSAPQQDEMSGLSKKLLETEAKLSQSQTSMKELLAQVEQKNQQIQLQESSNKKSLEELNQIKNTVSKTQENETKLNSELATVKASLKNKEAELENNKKSSTIITPVVDDSKVKELENALNVKTEEYKKLEENVDSLKKKNNDLREKNWKAIDALNKSEDESKKSEKSLAQTVCKSIKSIYPDLKLPKTDKGLQNFFEEFQTSCQQHIAERQKSTNEEIDTLKSANEDLQKQLADTDNNTKIVGGEELEKMKVENQKLKSVLGDTEVMLSKLQSGVDAEIKSWQDKVSNKENDMKELQTKLNSMEAAMKEHGFVQEETPHTDTHHDTPTKKKHGWTYKLTKIIHPKMETTLKETQKELEKEKQEKNTLQASTKELENKLKEAQTKLDESNKKVASASDSSKLDEVSSKLKKTISERDLLIREYKKSKDSVAKFEVSVKEKDNKLAGIADVHKKELKKLQDQVIALESTSKVSGKGDKEKDKIIAKLYLEIEELKDDLREERDRVIVDIETPDSENLHRQVETLTTELQQEKEDKFNLSLKYNDLEKSYQEEQSDKDKVMNLESQLKAAEGKISELETSMNANIENEIEDAMKV